MLFEADVAFPINMSFWVAFLCLEAAAVVQSKSKLDDMLLDEDDNDDRSFKPQLLRLQQTALSAMRRILEDSEFFRQLRDLQEVPQEFYLYSLGFKARKTALLSLLFVALENPRCASDAYQILIMSIKI